MRVPATTTPECPAVTCKRILKTMWTRQPGVLGYIRSPRLVVFACGTPLSLAPNRLLLECRTCARKEKRGRMKVVLPGRAPTTLWTLTARRRRRLLDRELLRWAKENS